MESEKSEKTGDGRGQRQGEDLTEISSSYPLFADYDDGYEEPTGVVLHFPESYNTAELHRAAVVLVAHWRLFKSSEVSQSLGVVSGRDRALVQKIRSTPQGREDLTALWTDWVGATHGTISFHVWSSIHRVQLAMSVLNIFYPVVPSRIGPQGRITG